MFLAVNARLEGIGSKVIFFGEYLCFTIQRRPVFEVSTVRWITCVKNILIRGGVENSIVWGTDF